MGHKIEVGEEVGIVLQHELVRTKARLAQLSWSIAVKVKLTVPDYRLLHRVRSHS
jgi:hypothetical protein